jgi:glutaredoxin
MVTVYGADWCEDTQKSLRHLRRLGVDAQYENVDVDEDALSRAKLLNSGRRQTPTIKVGAMTLVEPSNDDLTRALEGEGLLQRGQAAERLQRFNVGDLERAIRIVGGTATVVVGALMRSRWKWPLMTWGAVEAWSGATGSCPVYRLTGRTSMGGPLDHPTEAERTAWLAPVPAR